MAEEKKEELIISSDPSSFTEDSEKNDHHEEKGKYSMDHEAAISILVVNMDYTLTKHSINDQFQSLPGNPLQPVIRIFGSAANGQRACLHIHGVLPYIYFRPENIHHIAFETEDKVKVLLPILERSLEDIMNLKRESIPRDNQQSFKKKKHIHHLETVRKKTIYGMSMDPIVFVKLFLNDPGDIKRVANILDEGALAGIAMQTYESHIPYLLKFTTDFNISPMGWIHLRNMKFRPPLPSLSQIQPLGKESLKEAAIEHTPVQVTSPSFVSPLKTQFPFFSAMSPTHGKLQTSESQNFCDGKDKCSGDGLSLFTQETVPKQFVWEKDDKDKTEEKEELVQDNSSGILFNGMKIGGEINSEVLELLDGINPEDLFTQKPTFLEATAVKVMTAPPNNPPKKIEKPLVQPWIREKDSTCEVELDAHCVSIMNANIPRREFGEELWVEERLRCLRKKLPPDELPAPLFTQSFHRDLYLFENDFAVRLKKLQKKGVALRKASRKALMKSSNGNESTEEILSQFLTADELNTVKSHQLLESAPATSTLFPKTKEHIGLEENSKSEKEILEQGEDEDIENWVQRTLEYAVLQSQADDTSVSDICSAPENIVEEYIKSQISQGLLIKNSLSASPVNKDMKDTSSQLDLEEEELSEEQLAEENNDILSCTQGDNFETLQATTIQPRQLPEIRSSISSNSNITDNSKPFYPPKLEVIEILDEEEEIIVKEESMKANEITNSSSNLDPMKVEEETATFEKLVPTVRKRSNENNRLTSAFKRFKSSHSTTKSVRFQEELNTVSHEIEIANEVTVNTDSPEKPLAEKSALKTPSSSTIPTAIVKKTKKSVSFAPENIFITDTSAFIDSPPPSSSKNDDPFAKTIDCIDLTEDSPIQEQASSATAKKEPGLPVMESIVLISPSPPSTTTLSSGELSSIVSKPSTSANSQSPQPSMDEFYNNYNMDSEVSFQSPLYYEYFEAKTLLPTFSAPKFSELADLSNFGLLPVQNPPVSYSSAEDSKPIDINATSAYNQYMLLRHPILYQKDVKVFDGGFPDTISSLTQILYPVATNSKALYSSLTSRKRCLIPSFHPPKPKLFFNQAADSNMKATHKNSNIPSASWFKSQIATPTQTPHSLTSNTSTPSSNSNPQGKAAIGSGINQSLMNKMTRLITLSMELFCVTRKDLLPNPKYDAIQMLCWIAHDTLSNSEHEFTNRLNGLICILPPAFISKVKQQYSQSMAKGKQGSSQTMSSEDMKAEHEAIINLAKAKFKFIIQSSLQNQPENIFSVPKDIHIDIVLSEQDLFQAFFDVVKGIDPDFLMGYENQNLSFGYFIKRGKTLSINTLQNLSRLPKEKPSFRNTIINVQNYVAGSAGEAEGDPTKNMIEEQDSRNLDETGNNVRMNDDDDVGYENQNDCGIFIKGRTFLNIWQIMRSEVRLSNSSLQYVVNEVLGERIPSFAWSQLSRWYLHPTTRFKVVNILYQWTVANILLIEKLDLIRKISESSRLYGIDFYSVLNRGSQYRVEAALLIRSNALDFVLISPSRQRVAQQAAMEVIPLVMEPKSGIYTDPVLVLDFQSLYPSMMIAYNLCFSTCLGKLHTGVGGQSETTGRLGVVNYPETMSAVNSTLHLNASNNMRSNAISKEQKPFVAPNGSAFCSKQVRHGILPRMVKEMLTTRIMVKRSMKRHCNNSSTSSSKVLEKVLDARQLAIKLLCNVTYGYTAAGFSGRMPMAELADAIVQCGRSTLEWTIQTIKQHPTWKAEVVYGDTDSVFVHLPGRSLEQAFAIGEEIAKEITSKQPEDVVLKFEKVYYPCILLTKKRYVGNCYESLSQKHAHLDAKGIEMIRRDQCAATMKIQEKTLRLLFSTRDMSLVKSYLQTQWQKILQGLDSILLQDFIFYKEVKFGQYASVSSQPPGAIVATKAVLNDEMAIPPYNWRVPYIVVQGLPNAPLKHLVHDPKELLRRGSHLRLNATYYILKCINPALDRVLSLCGVDVQLWFRELSKPKARVRHINYDLPTNPFGTLDHKTGNSEVIELDFFGRKKTSTVSKLPHQKQQTLMDQFTTQAACELCSNDSLPQKNLCQSCLDQSLDSMTLLMNRLNMSLNKEKQLELQCRACAHSLQPSSLFTKQEMIGNDACQSMECPVFHERNRLITRIEDYQLATRDITSM